MHRHCQDRSVIVASASSSTSWPLPGITDATQSSAPPVAVPGARAAASTPGSATCTRSAASAYSSSSASGPAARRDDRGGGCRAPRPPVPGRRRPPGRPQRHVHERDQPQPARLRHQHLRGRRGDQPVEQHHGAVGNPPDDAGERGVGGLVGPRPGAGHGVHAHRPADRCQAAADPAVVGVAAARPGRVVDAVGDDDVHRRSQRPLVARPRHVRLVQRHDEPGQRPRAVAEGAGVHARRRADRRPRGRAPPSRCSMPAKAGSSSRLR